MLTAAQYEALRTILRTGGNVRLSQGRKRPDTVNKALAYALDGMGLIFVHAPRADGGKGFRSRLDDVGFYVRSGPVTVHVEVTAAGCVAFHDEEQRRTYRALVKEGSC